eukprot:1895790-Amphidinium_carterae.1
MELDTRRHRVSIRRYFDLAALFVTLGTLENYVGNVLHFLMSNSNNAVRMCLRPDPSKQERH